MSTRVRKSRLGDVNSNAKRRRSCEQECSHSRSSAANEVYDFYPIAVADSGFFPILSRYYFPVQLDGDPLSRQRQKFQELFQINFSGNFAFFSVDKNLRHSYGLYFLLNRCRIQTVRPLTVLDRSAEFDLLAVAHRTDEHCGSAGVEIRKLQIDPRHAVCVG